MSDRFRVPKAKEVRQPISARINESTYKSLSVAAEKSGMSLSELVSDVLEDYVKFLRKKGYK